MATRRQFLHASMATVGTASLGLGGCATDVDPGSARGPKSDTPSLDILILGGTGFIGPHMVEHARSRGHTVTLFNRGKTNADLFPEVETLVGDRDGDLDALRGRTWDGVIDNSGYVPRHVRDSAQLLSDNAGQYLFISTVSVYADFATTGITEAYPVAELADPTVEEVTGATYGGLKALCEEAVTTAFDERATVVRPGYIVGPRDGTDRWTYWLVRAAEGGEVLVPGSPNDPVQFIDARDLAAFAVSSLENRTHGRYNAVGPADPLGMGAMLQTLASTGETPIAPTWIEPDRLQAQGVLLPIWADPQGDTRGVHQISNERAMGAGLSLRPPADTARDTLAWWRGLSQERRAAMRSGLRIRQGAAPPPRTASLEEQMAWEAQVLAELAATA